MNPAKAYAHLFSPHSPDDAEGYGTPGQIAFLRADYVPPDPARLKKVKARYAFIGVPFDEGNIGKPGCEEGPREFRLASQEYFPYWFEYNVDLHGRAVDCGDVQFLKVNPAAAYERIYKAVRDILGAGLTPIICGGDRSISIPAARALSDHIGKKKRMGCLHFGANLDMADTWAGQKNVAPCAMARITELPNLKAENVAVVGVRNSMNPKDYFDLAKSRGMKFYSMFEMIEKGVDKCAKEAVERVWKGTQAQYLSFNFNVMDASDAPGVTMPEPGGLESREMIRIADMIGAHKGVSVIDVTELSPVFDVSGTTSRLAVCTVLRIMASIARAKGETVDQKIRRPAPKR
ncbi:MAG TPA: agmatinase family protein [Alphaproteobacteria bacterium]|nr:agmatinase family protein [Alphaproteobacteria bacterium]